MGWLKTRTERNEAGERTLAPVITLERRTLAQRLGEGRLPFTEGLRLAVELAGALRALHEAGRVHGALTPFAIELTAAGLELLPAHAPRGIPGPYTAPEVLNGQPANAQSDIFSFGAILFEMMTGRWAFEADTPEALAVALQTAPPPRTGDAALDAVIGGCLAKDPAARWPHIRRAQLQLKLASVSARRSEDPQRRAQFDRFVREAVEHTWDSRVAGTLESQQAAIGELRQAAAASVQRIGRVEQAMDAAARHAAEFAGTVAAQLHALEQTVRAQAEALEAARAALAQTDDLVERIVEALDHLQSTVLERTEFIAGAMAPHNGLRTVRPISS